MEKQFNQIEWDELLIADLRAILDVAIREDLGDAGDLTTAALVPDDAPGRAAVVARQVGVIAGLPAAELAIRAIDPLIAWSPEMADGQQVQPGDRIALLEGPAAGILRAERVFLNLLGRLSGIATLTRRYVEAVADTGAKIFDTRKTTPGWRRLEKYAVRCGGGWNHRTGLFEAVLIKDNHLALGAEVSGDKAARYTPAEAVGRARDYLNSRLDEHRAKMAIVEIEVDTLEQFEEVLPAGPDIVLLDNMSPDQLRRAVAARDATWPDVRLEASGGIDLTSVRAVAAAGVDHISVGGLTHSVAALDLGLDWLLG